MIEADGAYRTGDMTLATVLVASGFKYILERHNRKRAAWVFLDVDSEREDDFDDLVDSYESGSCRVEPRAFVEELARVRTELYRFLGVGSRQHDGTAPAARPA